MPGYKVGATLPAGEPPWPVGWEQNPKIDNGHEHEWECVMLTPTETRRLEEVVRCVHCKAPRCGDSGEEDPCMERRHHRTCHRYLSGWTEHVGGSAGTCGCS